MQHQRGIPQGFTRVVIHGRMRLIPISGNRTVVTRQRVGEMAGRTTAVLATPIEMAWDGLKALGRGVRDSHEGQGFQYGYHQVQRSKEVWHAARALDPKKNEAYIRMKSVELGLLNAEQAHSQSIATVARIVADYGVADRYIDDETYDVYTDQEVVYAAAPEPVSEQPVRGSGLRVPVHA